MQIRGLNISLSEDIVELRAPNGLTVLKVRVLKGRTGNLQVLAYPQPFTRLHIEPKQSELATIIRHDPADTDVWPPETY